MHNIQIDHFLDKCDMPIIFAHGWCTIQGSDVFKLHVPK